MVKSWWKEFLKMAFRIWSRGCNWGRGQKDATTKELQELKEIIETIEMCGIHQEEANDDEEEFVEEA